MNKEYTIKKLNTDKLKEEMNKNKFHRIKNYKTMVSILGDKEIKLSKDRKSQLKEWKRFFDYKITSNKIFEIKEIYETPLPKKESKAEIERNNKIKRIKYITPTVIDCSEIKIDKPIIPTNVMSIYGISKKIKYKSLCISGYTEFCKILNIPEQNDIGNRWKQLKELNHFINYKIVGDTYIIEKVKYPLITKDCFIFNFLNYPDYYYMNSIYSYCDDIGIKFDFIEETYMMMDYAYYHYKEQINTWRYYPEEKELQIKIEKIIDSDNLYELIINIKNFTSQYNQDYTNGKVDKKLSKQVRTIPRKKRMIVLYEEEYEKIMKYINDNKIKYIETKQI